MARNADRPWYWKARGGWYTTFGGKQVLLAKGRANKAVAEKKLLELRLEAASNPGIDSERQTVGSVLDAYLGHAKRHLSARHFEHEKSLLQQFNDAHGFRVVTECRPIHLTQWVDGKPQWKAAWTLHRVIATVKRPFLWAMAQKLIESNPFHGVNHRQGGARRPVTDAEFQSLLRSAPGRMGKPFRQALIFMRFTGCRPGEMAGLRWSDIDLANRKIVLAVHKTVKLTKEPRVLPLIPTVVKLLIHRRKVSRGDHVFVNAYSNPWHRSAMALRLKRARERQGIPSGVTLYGIRHSFGTSAIVRGVDIKTLAQLMGHTSTRMTEHYLHLAGQGEHLEQSMRRATERRRGA